MLALTAVGVFLSWKLYQAQKKADAAVNPTAGNTTPIVPLASIINIKSATDYGMGDKKGFY